MLAVPASPKVHAHEVGEFVPAPVKTTVKGIVPVTGVPEKDATGGCSEASTVTYPVRVCVLVPYAFAAVIATLYVPAVAYWWLGFCALLVPPSPKVHAHEVGVPEDASVKTVVSGATPLTGTPVKDATGAGGREEPLR
jgi:hypothetical protein